MKSNIHTSAPLSKQDSYSLKLPKIQIAIDIGRREKPKAIINRTADFWLLGGLSLVLWAVMIFANSFRGYASVGHHFSNIPFIFGTLALICNYPHFMVSYKFAYGRGTGFVKSHWVSLIAVPLLLMALLYFAFSNLATVPEDILWLTPINNFLQKFNVGLKIGTLSKWGIELLSYSFWIMNLTVGWHYSKQVYGCLVAYSKFDNYPLTKNQKMILRLNLLSIGWLNFAYISHQLMYQSYTTSAQMVSLALPEIFTTISTVLTVFLSVISIIFVFGRNYLMSHRAPSWNFILPWIALHIWWVPVFRQSEYYLFAVPFFHCLQYLPFAYKLDTKESKAKEKPNRFALYINIALIFIAGFLSFEFIPNILDNAFETVSNFNVWFFTGAAIVFINVHHFFMDSVIWKSNFPYVKGQSKSA